MIFLQNGSLLENGLDYILNSLNHLKSIEEKTGSKYSIKYGIRDLISGIEIILKYRLECDHWTFVVDDLNKLTLNDYQSSDFISVTLEQAIKRLQKLCNVHIGKSEEEVLKSLKKIRNKIEHFRLHLQETEAISLVYNSITILLRFMDSAPCYFLDKFSKEEKEMYLEIKKKILRLEDYLDKREKEIQDQCSGADLKVCPICKRKCVTVKDVRCTCHLCGSVYEDTSYKRKEYIKNQGPSIRDIAKGSPSIEEIECPFCGDVMLLDYEKDEAMCFLCRSKLKVSELDCCSRCGRIGVKDLCSDCIRDIDFL